MGAIGFLHRNHLIYTNQISWAFDISHGYIIYHFIFYTIRILEKHGIISGAMLRKYARRFDNVCANCLDFQIKPVNFLPATRAGRQMVERPRFSAVHRVVPECLSREADHEIHIGVQILHHI